MRTGLMVLVLASLAAFTVASAEASEVQPVQESESAAAESAPAVPNPAVAQVVPASPAAMPAAAATPDAAAVAAGAVPASAPPAAADQARRQEAAAHQSITLKMATVPPPADFKIPAGYRPVNRGLDTVYCTSIIPIGSRMPQTYCLTRDQVEERQRQAEIARREVAQKSGIAGTGGGG
jgi:hypothetical protein